MYDIRQFKPALYVLIILGLSGFALAAQSPGLWVLSTGAVLFNAWLVKTNRFTPMPRLLANAVTLLAMVYVANQVMQSWGPPILVIGQFLVLLQLIKLFEQRGNRDYAQLLILSLLLVVAASINTASLLFAVLLISYMFLSLYCCLLFHLKVETDEARKAISVPEQEPNPAALRQDQRHLSRSMRQLTGIVSSVALIMSVVVFLLFPRNTGAGFLGPLQFRSSQTLTGFSEQVNFDEVAKITQNNSVVAHVRVWHNSKPVHGAQTLLLRGVALDLYGPVDSTTRSGWQWSRSPTLSNVTWDSEVAAGSAVTDFRENGKGDQWRQEVNLQPTGTNVLFAMGAPVQFKPARGMRVRYYRADQSLQSVESIVAPLTYEVISRQSLTEPAIPTPAGDVESPLPKVDLTRIREYALAENVTGRDAQGPLAARKLANPNDHTLDEAIATNIEQHLRSSFSYTLDLTDAGKFEGDPLVAFLYTLKRGHCEYFAGAMALMCQSLGLQARVVVGFKCDEYNNTPGADYYIVRQSHAHAWCEVLMPDQTWRTFDPTSARDAPTSAQTLWTRAKHVFDFLEYSWASHVVAYDRESRENLMQRVETKLVNSSANMGKWQKRLFNPQSWTLPEQLRSWLVAITLAVLITMAGWFIWDRVRMRRRAHRIGIDTLPPSDKARLVRQLGFYDDLMRMLEKHGITRPRHLTPMEFSETLSYLPNDTFDAVRRLTNVFYRIRFGGAELSPMKRQRLSGVIARVEKSIGEPAAKRVGRG